jgi:hypothetical protein
LPGDATTTTPIEDALVAPTKFEFADTPLSSVIDQLKQSNHIEIQLDNRALDDAGVSADTPISIRMTSTALRSGLRLVLERFGLTYMVGDGYLLITTPSGAERWARGPAALHFDDTKPSPAMAADEAKIRDALVAPTKFEFADTPLSNVIDQLKQSNHIEIQLDKRALDDAGVSADTPLSIRLTSTALRSGLRLMLEQIGLTYMLGDGYLLITTPSGAERWTKGPAPLRYDNTRPTRTMVSNEAKIKAALKSRTVVEFNQTPLCDVLDSFQERHKIPIFVDRRALDEIGIADGRMKTSNQPYRVTNSMRGVTLQGALALILDRVGATFTIRDEVLFITTPKQMPTKASSTRKTRTSR